MPTFEPNTIRSLASRVRGMELSRQHSPRCLMASRTRRSATERNLHLPFGDQPLQQLIRGAGQVHVLGVRPDQDMVGLEDQVHRLGGQLFLLLQAERRQALRGALGVDAVNEAQPLQRVHAGQLGPERAVGREQGADASDLPALLIPRERMWSNQFQLHSALAFNYWTIRLDRLAKGQPKAAERW